MQISQLRRTLKGCVELQCHIVGIPKITKKNYKEFFRRGKLLQILGSGVIDHLVDDSVDEGMSRSLTINEAEEHIGFVTNGISLDNKKWKNQVFAVMEERITDLATMEDEELVPYTKAKETINEGNARVMEDLDSPTKEEPIEYPH